MHFVIVLCVFLEKKKKRESYAKLANNIGAIGMQFMTLKSSKNELK